MDWKQNLYNGNIRSRLETGKNIGNNLWRLEVKVYGLSTESKMGRVVLLVILWSSISLRINDHQSGSIRSQRIVLSYHKPEIMRFSTGNIRSEFIRIF